jgi:hypothetical protein
MANTSCVAGSRGHRIQPSSIIFAINPAHEFSTDNSVSLACRRRKLIDSMGNDRAGLRRRPNAKEEENDNGLLRKMRSTIE